MRLAVLALLVGGCGESFIAPEDYDLYKPPIDFAQPSSSKDMGMGDLAELPDLAAAVDGTLAGDHDLSSTD